MFYVRFEELINSHPAVLFMKGTPSFPLCGLSARVCLLLKKHSLNFKAENLLQDPQLYVFLRQKHFLFSAPYLYLDSRFFGGYDEILTALNVERTETGLLPADFDVRLLFRVWPTGFVK
jgi:monothiol glutaredoxin